MNKIVEKSNYILFCEQMLIFWQYGELSSKRKKMKETEESFCTESFSEITFDTNDTSSYPKSIRFNNSLKKIWKRKTLNIGEIHVIMLRWCIYLFLSYLNEFKKKKISMYLYWNSFPSCLSFPRLPFLSLLSFFCSFKCS